MVAELAGLIAGLVVALGEALHVRRCRRLARLAFGPTGRPAPWARSAPILRVAAASALAWGMATLMLVPPRTFHAEAGTDAPDRHLLVVLDVSPSMRLEDAGPEGTQSRTARVATLMESFFRRVPVEQYLLSIVACYNGAKPVVVDAKDMEVVRNILHDLPMNYAFRVGKTDLFAGLEEAARIAHPWNPRSATLLLISDGDTVPATGMPKLPASIREVLVVGVGNPRSGTFIDGHLSRQDASTLRQIAVRLRGRYHDGNEKHLPSGLLAQLAIRPEDSPFERLTRREYALIAAGLGASVLAFLPLLLHRFGTGWQPGIPPTIERPARKSRGSGLPLKV